MVGERRASAEVCVCWARDSWSRFRTRTGAQLLLLLLRATSDRLTPPFSRIVATARFRSGDRLTSYQEPEWPDLDAGSGVNSEEVIAIWDQI